MRSQVIAPARGWTYCPITTDAASFVEPTLRVPLQKYRPVSPQYANQLPPKANGGLYDYAFANGAITEPPIMNGAAGPFYKAGEPETIWEAFIGGKPSQRDRNVGIWMGTGGRLGALVQIVKSAVTATSGGAGRHVEQNIYPQRGMTETQICDAAARQLNFIIRGNWAANRTIET